MPDVFVKRERSRTPHWHGYLRGCFIGSLRALLLQKSAGENRIGWIVSLCRTLPMFALPRNYVVPLPLAFQHRAIPLLRCFFNLTARYSNYLGLNYQIVISITSVFMIRQTICESLYLIYIIIISNFISNFIYRFFIELRDKELRDTMLPRDVIYFPRQEPARFTSESVTHAERKGI